MITDNQIQEVLNQNAFKIYEYYYNQKINNFDIFCEIFSNIKILESKCFAGKIFYTPFNKIIFDDSPSFFTKSKIEIIK